MPRSFQPVEFNTFVAGYVTEASPLTFPPNASLDEENFILFRDGSRARRPGFDYEKDCVIVDSAAQLPADGTLITGSYRWTNVGGDGSKTFIVVQIQNSILFFDGGAQPISTGLIGTWQYDNSQPIVKFGFTSVDGILVVVTGRKDVDTFKYDGLNLTINSKRLLIRDLFGVTDVSATTTGGSGGGGGGSGGHGGGGGIVGRPTEIQ